jgi:hypothetical protein
MAKNRKKHPGVGLLKPNEKTRTGWRLRWVDPTTGKRVYESLDPDLGDEQRLKVAVNRSQQLLGTKVDMARGKVRKVAASGDRVTVEGAIEALYRDNPTGADEGETIGRYRRVTAKFIEWAKGQGVTYADKLEPDHLNSYRAVVMSERKMVHKVGGTRGEMVPSREKRAVATVNGDLRAMRTVLGHLLQRRQIPKVDQPGLEYAFKQLKAPQGLPAFLKAPNIAKLLDSALAHDEATFLVTRREHDLGVSFRGKTIKYEAIAPFALFVLLTGMRSYEAQVHNWETTDLDALAADGSVCGELMVPKERAKTRVDRIVELSVSPSVRELLLAMGPASRGPIFPRLTEAMVEDAMPRMIDKFKAPPDFTWKLLRATCATYLSCAPGIYGSAAAPLSAARCGHDITVAQKHYVGRLHGIPHSARTLEAAMGIEKQAALIIERQRIRSALPVSQQRLKVATSD